MTGELETVMIISLHPDSLEALNHAAECEGLSRTDVINRAVLVYNNILLAFSMGGLRLKLSEPSGEPMGTIVVTPAIPTEETE